MKKRKQMMAAALAAAGPAIPVTGNARDTAAARAAAISCFRFFMSTSALPG